MTTVAPCATARSTWPCNRVAASTDDSGPRTVPLAIGSPSGDAAIAVANLARNSSYNPSTTMKRFAALQDWPVLSSRASVAAATTASRSSVANTMNGSEPPSSRATFFRCRPATSATAAPARSEPVTDTPWIRGSATILAACSALTYTLMYAPSGSPASR